MADEYRKVCAQLCNDPNPPIVEKKHGASQILSWRTRGQATLMYMEGEKPILAKGGLKTPTGMDQGQEVEWIVESFRDRATTTTCELEVPHSLREIWKENRDWTKEAVRRGLAAKVSALAAGW